ncbi:MAG: Ig-like domain-containing protein [Gemmatimonadota bacterium]
MNARRLACLMLFGVFAAGCADTSPMTTAPASRPSANATATVHVWCPGAVFVNQSTWCSVSTYDIYGNPTYPSFVSWWSTSSAASVSPGGTVTGVHVGSATIAAHADGVTGYAGINVYAAPVPSKVEVSPSSATVYVGSTRQYTARLYDQYNNEMSGYSFSWSTSSSSVATVGSSGVVSGIGVGTATVTASAAGISGSAQVSVSQPPSLSISILGPSSLRSRHTCTWYADASGGTAPYSYSWSASGGSGYASDSQYTHSSSSSFSLYLTVTDATGASLSTSKWVSVSSSAPACEL